MGNPLLGLRSLLFQTGASEAITYTPPFGSPVAVRAVRSGDYAGSLSALGNPLRGVSFEIPRSSLLQRPARDGTIIGSDGDAWRITQVTDVEHAASWLMVVEATTVTPPGDLPSLDFSIAGNSMYVPVVAF